MNVQQYPPVAPGQPPAANQQTANPPVAGGPPAGAGGGVQSPLLHKTSLKTHFQAVVRSLLRGPVPAVAGFVAAKVGNPTGKLQDFLRQSGVIGWLVTTIVFLACPLVEKCIWGGHPNAWKAPYHEPTSVETANYAAAWQATYDAAESLITAAISTVALILSYGDQKDRIATSVTAGLVACGGLLNFINLTIVIWRIKRHRNKRHRTIEARLRHRNARPEDLTSAYNDASNEMEKIVRHKYTRTLAGFAGASALIGIFVGLSLSAMNHADDADAGKWFSENFLPGLTAVLVLAPAFVQMSVQLQEISKPWFLKAADRHRRRKRNGDPVTPKTRVAPKIRVTPKTRVTPRTRVTPKTRGTASSG